MSGEQTAVNYLNENYQRFADLARAIWERPEIGLQETFASKAIAEQLEAAGFAIIWIEDKLVTQSGQISSSLPAHFGPPRVGIMSTDIV